jgi:hypothetical protein
VIEAERAVLSLINGGKVVLCRRERKATYITPQPLDDEDLIHPSLAGVAGLFACWLGRQALHAGAVVVDGAAWGLLGGKEQGKSTLLAYLHLSGYSVLTDDALVLDDATAFAGPRCIDLREQSVRRLGAAGSVRWARSGTRGRLTLPPIDVAEVPVGGWVFLERADTVVLRRMSPGERLARLQQHRIVRSRAVDAMSEDPVRLLELASLPAWELGTPRRWDILPSAAERLLAAIAG